MRWDVHAPTLLAASHWGEAMDCKACCGRCALFLVLAILCDVVGLVILLVGIFAPISFWDFFVLSGPLLIFISLVFWIFWYLGNLTVPYAELLPHWGKLMLSVGGKAGHGEFFSCICKNIKDCSAASWCQTWPWTGVNIELLETVMMKKHIWTLLTAMNLTVDWRWTHLLVKHFCHLNVCIYIWQLFKLLCLFSLSVIILVFECWKYGKVKTRLAFPPETSPTGHFGFNRGCCKGPLPVSLP